MHRFVAVAAIACLSATVLYAAPAPPPTECCVGDCDGDGTTQVNEVIALLNILLGRAAASACPAAASWDAACGTHGVDISLVIRAVSTDLNGCRSCAPGTCRVRPDGACEAPTGNTGNACCECSDDGWCTFICICASPDTPIATPNGDVPISSLRAGDLVYSTDASGIVVVPVLETNRVSVQAHHVRRVRLATGAVLEISAGHPMADGRTFGELRVGDRLGDIEITAVEIIPFTHDFTYDILPASESGVYFAAGVPVGSTLHPRRASLCSPRGAAGPNGERESPRRGPRG